MASKNLLLGSSLVCVLLFSGCIGLGPESLAFANPLVKQFMDQYPNAQLTVTHYSIEESSQVLEQLSKDCGKEYSEGKELYKITIDDSDSGLNVIAWIDMNTQTIECAVKYGKDDEKTISDSDGEEKNCKSHAEYKCYGEHVYWFDSCGHKEDKKEYCQEGCELGFCKEKGEGCEAHHQTKCHDGHVYWVDSCGNKEEKKQYCEHGCDDGKCKEDESIECFDSDEGKDYYTAGVVESGNSRLEDHCNSDGTLTEKYCYDEKTIKAETVECPEGYVCEGAKCVVACADSDEGKDYYTKGQVTGPIGEGEGSNGWDYCLSLQGDQWVTVDEGTHLIEWWCTGEGGAADNEKIECPNGCEDGACKENVCIDTDGGDHYTSGRVFLNGELDSSMEACLNENDVKENYCYEGDPKAGSFTCPNGCLDGACVIDKGECTDTDGGKEYYLKGSTSHPSGNPDKCVIPCEEQQSLMEGYCNVEECSGDECYVIETYCREAPSSPYQEVYQCLYGCSDGACLVT